MPNGKTITLFLVDGTADGLITAEIGNSVCKVIVAPRTSLPKLLSQSDLKCLGVYILIGNTPNQKPQLYIGQGDLVARLHAHDTDPNKDFWNDKVAVIIDRAHTLNQAHCSYLEKRFIQLSVAANLAKVNNTQQSLPPALSKFEIGNMEDFLEQALILLRVLDIKHFDSLPSVQTANTNQVNTTLPPVLQTQSPLFVLKTSRISVEAQLVNGKFVVKQGAVVEINETPSLASGFSKKRHYFKSINQLISNPQDGQLMFVVDVSFDSPSTAAAIICGYNIAGPTFWKVKATGQTFKDWKRQNIPTVVNTGNSQ